MRIDMQEIERIGGIEHGRNPDLAHAISILRLNDLLLDAEPVPPTLEEVAAAIHKARWPEDKQTESTPFADEDENGRTYCFRLARAVRHLYQEQKDAALA